MPNRLDLADPSCWTARGCVMLGGTSVPIIGVAATLYYAMEGYTDGLLLAVSIFARNGSIDFRPKWSTPKDDAGETPVRNGQTIRARQGHNVDSTATSFPGS